MINQITAHHHKEYGFEPSVICSSPGKIDLLGEHGESCRGNILSFAADKRFYVAASMRNDNSLRFYSANLNERKKTTLSGLKYKREDRWANYSKGVINAFLQMGFAVKGLNLTLFSEIPMGIGLASSSALTVATACALKSLFNLEIAEDQIVTAAWTSESRFMGLKVGIHSPLVSYLARTNQLALTDSNTLKIRYLPFPASSGALVVTDSRVPRNMSDRDRAEIDESCRECVRVLGLESGTQLLRDISRDDLSSTIDGLSERSRRIGLHMVTENMRIREFQKAMEAKSMGEAGRILLRSHESLRDLLEISCPELDWVAKRGVETDGVYGARMIGSGYGGCTVALMKGSSRRHYEERLEEYDRIFGFKASVFPVRVGSGSQVHRAEQSVTAPS